MTRRPDKVGLASSFAAFLAFVVFRSVGGATFTCFGVWALLWGFDSACRSVGRRYPENRVNLTAGGLICLYVALNEHVPVGWATVSATSLFLTNHLGGLTHSPMLFGPTASGLHVFVFFLLYVLSLFILSERRSMKTALVVSTFGFGVSVLYLLSLDRLFIPLLDHFHNPYHLGHMHYRPYPNTALGTGIFLSGLLCLPLYVAVRAWTPRAPVVPETKRLGFSIGLAATAVGVFVWAMFPISATVNRRVLFYDKGLLNWEKPQFGKYGDPGMFGMLPEYLAAAGFESRKTTTLSDRELDGCGTLVLVNLQEPVSPDEHEAVWRFVRNGGSLLAMGDHTGVGGIREPFNALLGPVGIEWNFDSGHDLQTWNNGFEVFPHPVTLGVENERALGIAVGASLEIGPGVAPLVVGKYGFSDVGNVNAERNAYLGDRQYNPGERLGDVVLVAATRLGKGKVLAFGDTSTFQNVSLVSAHRFLRNVFMWLGGAEAGWTTRRSWAALCLVFLGLWAAVSKPNRFSTRLPWITAAVAAGLVSAFWVNSLTGTPPPFKGNIARIDTSHLERISSEFHRDESFMGLTCNLIRNGYLPVEMNRFSESELSEAKLLVVAAPTLPFGSAESESLKRFMDRGGTVLWCAGWDEIGGSREMLAGFGFGIDHAPLGSLGPERNTAGVNFHNAWPIRIDNHQGARTIAALRGADVPLIVERERGGGRFVLISDGAFLSNANLESFTHHIPENTAFLKTLLETDGRREARNGEGGK